MTPLRRLLLSLTAAAAVFTFLGIVAPMAHAQQQLTTYFNFNDANETADFPGVQLTPTITQANLTPTFVTPGTTSNIAIGDPITTTTGNSALRLSFDNNGGGNPKTFQFSVNTMNLTNLSLSYATLSSVDIVQTLSYSTDGGTTFSSVGITPSSFTITASSSFSVVTFDLTAATAIENKASVIFRIGLTGAGANKGEFSEFDNIQLNAKKVPEPATIGAALLCALGVCWHQRRLFWKALQLSRFKVRTAA